MTARSGVGTAPADLSHFQDFRRDPGAALRLSAQAAHPDQARVQESEMDHGDIRDQPLPRRGLGRPWLQLVCGRGTTRPFPSVLFLWGPAIFATCRLPA